MKQIDIKCIILCYNISNFDDNFHILKDAVHSFCKNANGLIIIVNDTIEDNKEVVQKFDLKNRSNVVVISFYKNLCEVLNLIDQNITNINCSSIIEGIKSIQKEFSVSSKNTISIGQNKANFDLQKCSFIHFHVGEQSLLKKKIRSVIPMWGQYNLGTSNIINYFLKNNMKDSALDYTDMINLVQNSIDFYRKKDAPLLVLQRHNVACKKLIEKFPNDIIAIFGTGYPHYLLDDTKNYEKNQHPNNLLDSISTDTNATTPESIFLYLEEQLTYFKQKTIKENTFIKNADHFYNSEKALQELDVIFEKNKFDRYKYNKKNFKLSELDKSKELTLKRNYENNLFDVEEDIWPCHYCATLQFPDIFPLQSINKDTNITCLSCNQTSFMLRNIMSCSTDIDIVVVVKENKEVLAKQIKDFIMSETDFYIYDLDFYKTVINENDGPMDIFVTQKEDFLTSLPKLLNKDWTKASFNSVALWSLMLLNHPFNIGEDFPLAFEPRIIKDKELYYQFFKTRYEFAKSNKNEDITSKLKSYTQPREQMLGNQDIIERMNSRLENWRTKLFWQK